MAHLGLVGQREQIGEGLVRCQGGQAERGDEFPGAAGHHTGDRHIVILQAARHFERLVGGDAAAHDQQHAAAGCDVGLFRIGKHKASRVDLPAARAQGFADRRVGALWQRSPRKVIADGAGADPEKVLQRLPPAKRGDDGGKITVFHIDSQFVNLYEFM